MPNRSIPGSRRDSVLANTGSIATCAARREAGCTATSTNADRQHKALGRIGRGRDRNATVTAHDTIGDIGGKSPAAGNQRKKDP